MTYIELDKCQRCAGSHKRIAILPFGRDNGQWSHWATCPEAREPILFSRDSVSGKPSPSVMMSTDDVAKMKGNMKFCATQAEQAQKMVEHLRTQAREHACERSSVCLELKEQNEELAEASHELALLVERQRKQIARLQAKAAPAKPVAKKKRRTR